MVKETERARAIYKCAFVWRASDAFVIVRNRASPQAADHSPPVPVIPPAAPTWPRYALDHLPKSQAADVYRRFVAFEKQQGDRGAIEDVVVRAR